MSTTNTSLSFPKGIKRRLLKLSQQGLNNKNKRRNNRKDQWTDPDFIPFAFYDEDEIKSQKENLRLRNRKNKNMKRGDNDEMFANLPTEIYFHICLYLSVDDRVVRGLLLVCREISCKMMGISKLDDMSRMGGVESSPYYELLTFLSIRNVIERFTIYSNKRKQFIQKPGDLERNRKDITKKWNAMSVEEQLEDLMQVSNSSRRRRCLTSRQIHNEKSEFSASKVFFRLENSIRELNKYFPHWLSSMTEFSDMSTMNNFIKNHRNIEILYQNLVNVKKVGIPVVSFAEDEFEFYENLDKKLNTILFDSKRLQNTRDKPLRNWKLMFEKQLEKKTHLEFTEQVFKLTKFNLDKVDTFSLENIDSNFRLPLQEIIRLATEMEKGKKLFYLFERNYAHGTMKLLKQWNLKSTVVTHRNNDFVGLYQHVLCRLKCVRFIRKLLPLVSDLLMKFTNFMVENWKQFYLLKHVDSPLDDCDLLYQFLIDGPRGNMTNLYIIQDIKLLGVFQAQYPEVFKKHFCAVSEFDQVPKTPRLRQRKNGKFI